MIAPKIRYACLHDLNGYFDKKTLLGGLSELEQEKLRSNIGIAVGNLGELGSVTNIIYDNLYDIFLSKSLIPGKRYIITDFNTIYQSNSGEVWGLEINPTPTTPICVTAISKDMLDPRVVFIDNDKRDWIVNYDITKTTWGDQSSKGSITYLKDSQNNSAPYDFKNIKWRVSESPFPNINDLYTFSDLSNNVLVDSSTLNNTRNNTLIECSNVVFIGDTYNNIFYKGSNNVYMKGSHDCTYLWDTDNNIIKEPTRYLTGSFSNKIVQKGNLILSSTISKTVHKVNSSTIVSYLDPITYSYQIEEL